MADLTINNKAVSVPDDYTILKACIQAGIDIPTFCNDDRLNAHGACRICLVEVAGEKLLCTSCSTPVRDGMEIKTHSKAVIEARKGVLELMIANHPLDCLTCEKSGGCKLQNYCYEYGIKDDAYGGQKKSFEIDDSNPYYYSDQNKCIMCGKCVRICKELQCTNAIDNVERGFEAHIGVPFNISIEQSDCISCGNCVSACPVGALMPKKSEKFRLWEVGKVETTCDGCSVGCPVRLLVKDERVLGVEPVEGASNGGLLCSRGKFGYGFINSDDRLTCPLVRKDGKLLESSWEEAYELIVSKIASIGETFGRGSFAALTSGRCSNEDNYMLKKLFRSVIKTDKIGCIGAGCGLKATDTADSDGHIEEKWIGKIIDRDLVFVIGVDPDARNPVVSARIRQAKAKGAKLIVADSKRTPLSRSADVFMQLMEGRQAVLIDAFADALSDGFREDKIEKTAETCGVDRDELESCMGILSDAKSVQIVYSVDVFAGTDIGSLKESIFRLRGLCNDLKDKNVCLNMLMIQSNEQGALDMGFSSDAMIEASAENEIKFFYLMACDMASNKDQGMLKGVKEADFVVVQDIFLTETAKMADVVLPASSFAEKDGTFTNTEGSIRKLKAVIGPVGDSKPDWMILMEIMNRLGHQKKYLNPAEIMDEIVSLDAEYAKKLGLR